MQEREWRRHLPHLDRVDAAQFITFRTAQPRALPPIARDIILGRLIGLNTTDYSLICAVVMPKHVHMILMAYLSLSTIVRRIKGPTAREINTRLHRSGSLWQDEYFDRAIRGNESLEEKVIYVRNNPIRAGLVSTCDEYPWLWCSSSEMWFGEQTSLNCPRT